MNMSNMSAYNPGQAAPQFDVSNANGLQQIAHQADEGADFAGMAGGSSSVGQAARYNAVDTL
jgi:hypothetical protein